LGVPAAARPGLERYLDVLADWSARVNLTGARTPATRVAVLVGEALPAADLVLPGRLLDVGSGNGSPGLVLALLRPELQVTLLEPRQRRWAFLREACRAAGRPDVEVLRARHDAWPGPPASTVTVRGLDLPLSALASLVRDGGRLVRFGRRRPVEPGWRAEPSPPGLQAFRREHVSRET
jgi:16S rRNA (guanine(527)-N(7))-methyltransferase RsmG